MRKKWIQLGTDSHSREQKWETQDVTEHTRKRGIRARLIREMTGEWSRGPSGNRSMNYVGWGIKVRTMTSSYEITKSRRVYITLKGSLDNDVNCFFSSGFS